MSKILAVFVALFVSAAGSAFADVADALIPSGNLTSFQNQQGMVNNNQYNQMIVRTSGSSGGGAATADFGNCNALIQRCATPKCGNGGCTDMGIATPIVAGCVAASSECKKHGDALVQFIAAQIVASNQVKANNAAAAQQQALAAQQAQQSQQQIEQMNAQMQQIQQQMAAQQAQSAQQMQEALAAQQAQNQALLEQQQAAAVAQQQVSSVISAPADMEAAIDRGVDANVIARQQIIGQVMSSLDGVDDGINSLKKIVEDLRTYANCDYSIAKCEGPKRVAAFRHKAKQFFDPYDDVAIALEDSIFTAQTAGVDVTEIYMLLSGSCMQWAKYVCQFGEPLYYCRKGETFSIVNDGLNNKKGVCGSGYDAPVYKTSEFNEQHSNPNCTPTGLYKQSESETVQQDWLISIEEGNKTKIKLACISEGAAQMMASNLGRRSKSKTSGSLDVDAMQTMINFDLDEKVADDRGRNQYQCLPSSYSSGIGSYITSLKSILNNKNFDYKNTKTGITDEDGNLNVGWSICDTHAHNIGEDNNPEDSEKKEQMDEVIALKSTIMVRLFKKQYDFLAAMIKQVKTQMQKSVMTATAEAAGATKESSSGNNAVSGQIDCRNKNRADTISCVRNNMTALQQMVDSRKTSDFRNAIKWNVEALKGVGAESDKDIVIKFNDKCPNNMSGANMTDCITEMRSALQMLEDKEREANRSTYNGR